MSRYFLNVFLPWGMIIGGNNPGGDPITPHREDFSPRSYLPHIPAMH